MEVIHLSQNTLEWEEAHAFHVVHAVTVTSLLLDIVKAACFHWSITWNMLCLCERLILVSLQSTSFWKCQCGWAEKINNWSHLHTSMQQFVCMEVWEAINKQRHSSKSWHFIEHSILLMHVATLSDTQVLYEPSSGIFALWIFSGTLSIVLAISAKDLSTPFPLQ